MDDISLIQILTDLHYVDEGLLFMPKCMARGLDTRFKETAKVAIDCPPEDHTEFV